MSYLNFFCFPKKQHILMIVIDILNSNSLSEFSYKLLPSSPIKWEWSQILWTFWSRWRKWRQFCWWRLRPKRTQKLSLFLFFKFLSSLFIVLLYMFLQKSIFGWCHQCSRTKKGDLTYGKFTIPKCIKVTVIYTLRKLQLFKRDFRYKSYPIV